MAVSVAAIAGIVFLDVFAFVFAIGAEMRRSTGTVQADQYDSRTYCVYDSDASTVYGLSGFGLLLLSQAVVSWASGCGFRGRGGGSRGCTVVAFVVFWLSFLVAEACLVAGSARNAYHTKYVGYYVKKDLVSCTALRKGVFAAAAAFVLISLVASLVFYWKCSKTGSDSGGWVRHRNEGGVGLTDYGPDKAQVESSKA